MCVFSPSASPVSPSLIYSLALPSSLPVCLLPSLLPYFPLPPFFLPFYVTRASPELSLPASTPKRWDFRPVHPCLSLSSCLTLNDQLERGKVDLDCSAWGCHKTYHLQGTRTRTHPLDLVDAKAARPTGDSFLRNHHLSAAVFPLEA